MKTKKKESVNKLKREIKELERSVAHLENERARYRDLVVEFYKEALSAVSGDSKMLIKPEYIIRESVIVFIRSDYFYASSLKK